MTSSEDDVDDDDDDDDNDTDGHDDDETQRRRDKVLTNNLQSMGMSPMSGASMRLHGATLLEAIRM